MKSTRTSHRIPRAHIDPIDHPAAALAMIGLAVAEPLRNETIVVMLDDARRGVGLFIVSGTDDHQAVLEVVDCFNTAAGQHELVHAFIVASVRTSSSIDSHNHAVVGAHDDADIDRWFEMSHLAEEAGIELVEWFIIQENGGITCPRDLIGESPRW